MTEDNTIQPSDSPDSVDSCVLIEARTDSPQSIASDEGPEGPIECGICKENIGEEFRVELRPCHHSEFCIRCINAWIDDNPTCPMCRSEITRLIFGARDETDGERDAHWRLLRDHLVAAVGCTMVITIARGWAESRGSGGAS
jgi:hypothetical protein